MDFMVGLPRTQAWFDRVWVIVDRLTKTSHFLPFKTKWSVSRLTELFISKIVRLHGVSVFIMSDKDPRFTSHFWRSFQEVLGTELHMSSAYHPQSDGQSERTIQILEDMLRACCMDWRGSWTDYVPLTEFVYNNNYQASIDMAPFETLYGRLCRSPLCWDEVGDRLI